MGSGKFRNEPCNCGSLKKYKKCCKPLGIPYLINNNEIILPHRSGNIAEDFIEILSKKAFLNPWVFRSPMHTKISGKTEELCDILVYFKNTVIIFQIKGNKFDPQNPQRYIKEAKKRANQLETSKRKIKNNLEILLKNNYQELRTDFSNVKNIYLISISDGNGEKILANGGSEVDWDKCNFDEYAKYLGFYNHESDIHHFTINEFEYLVNIVDTLQDFFWYLIFEKKFFTKNFSNKIKGEVMLVLNADKSDLMASFVQYYYWDDDLNKRGEVILDKLLGDIEKIKDKTLVSWFCDEYGGEFKNTDFYKKIINEKKESKLWDEIINNSYIQLKKDSLDEKSLRIFFEKMSAIPRFQRYDYSKLIKDAERTGVKIRIMRHDTAYSENIFVYVQNYFLKTPTWEEEIDILEKNKIKIEERIIYGEEYKDMKEGTYNICIIAKHYYGRKHIYRFIHFKLRKTK